MKRTIKSLVLLGAIGATILAPVPTAYAQERGLYVKGDLGGNWTPNVNLTEFFGPVAPGSKVKFDPGVRAGIAGGYQVTDWFAGEAELGVFENRIDSITDATRVHDAWFANVPLLFNAKFQLPNRTPLTPYVGGGIGFAESILDVQRLTIGDVSLHGNQADTVFAYQAFAGLRYALNERMGLSLEYRYFAAESPSWGADFASGTGTDRVRFGRVQTHAISLAFDFRF